MPRPASGMLSVTELCYGDQSCLNRLASWRHLRCLSLPPGFLVLGGAGLDPFRIHLGLRFIEGRHELEGVQVRKVWVCTAGDPS